ncbi:MAG: cell division protein FtsX [Epsilonproteobacteria bacterium]|nr:cell division protein FtsX [Campylobacterota bacterium]MBD3839841.1 cell division protein FtsX [Campylobacterota bacterium]
MKFIKRHLSIIFPLMAILLGLEFFIAFDRTTKQYEKSLQDEYSMLIVSKDEMSIDDITAWDKHIIKIEDINKSEIIGKINQAMEVNSTTDAKIKSAIPNFYAAKIDKYLDTTELQKIKTNLLKNPQISRVETFDSVYKSNYGLFSFIKFSFRTFIIFMSIIGFFLIIKQMEVWNYIHAQRMRVMEIFGAPLLFRSKVLIRVAIIDAIIASFITSFVFWYLQYIVIANGNVTILDENIGSVFSVGDIFILLFTSLFIALTAVLIVVMNIKEE